MTKEVPQGLRAWFIAHFVVDMLFGIPLLFFPSLILPLFGWTTYDPITSRLVGAALIGIGLESFFVRDAALATFKTMLDLKIIWASAAALGIALGLLEGAPAAGWLFLLIFAVFGQVWVYYRGKLRRV